jgi:hypothetical protein
VAKFDGFSDRQARALEAELAALRFAIEQLKTPDRVLDRRGAGVIRPRPGDVVRANDGDVVILPHPRSAKGRDPVVVLVESQPVTVKAESGTVNDAAEVTTTTLGAMNWYSTGTEWWGSAVGGSGGSGGGADPPATGAEDGFLSRHVYANAASSLVGTTFFGVTVEAATTLSTTADLDDGNRIRVIVWGAGGTGANGQFQNASGTSQSAGGGGGGGARQERWYARADVVDALPVAMTIAGTTAAPANATTQNTASTGNAGGPTLFGSLLSAFGGGGGFNQGSASNSGGAGGGWSAEGQSSTGGATFGGGAAVSNAPGSGGAGAGSQAPGTTPTGRQAVGGGGASGGNCQNQTGTAGGRGFDGGGGERPPPRRFRGRGRRRWRVSSRILNRGRRWRWRHPGRRGWRWRQRPRRKRYGLGRFGRHRRRGVDSRRILSRLISGYNTLR